MMKQTYLCPICGRPLYENYECGYCSRNFSGEILASSEGTLTEYQMAKQDLIDNACADLIRKFVPAFKHDIEQISVIREALTDVLQKHYRIAEFDLYPWLLEPEGGD